MAICQDIIKNVQAEDTAEVELGDSGAISHHFNMINNKICEIPVTISTGGVTEVRNRGDITLVSEKGKS